MNKIIYAKITGTGHFPVDMLRYDLCSPATEEDSHLIENTFNIYAKNWVIFVKRPLLERRKKTDQVFTYGRWQSFGCQIEEVDSPYGKRLTA
jgi:hypothetical protein